MKNEVRSGKLSEGAHGLGTVTEEMVRHRAREIAETNGRLPRDFNAADLDQARSELLGRQAGTSEMEEDFREWDELPAQPGRPGIEQKADDEQTFAEELVEEGIQEAEHEQMVQGNRASRAKDQA
jgi:hypothetical protein